MKRIALFLFLILSVINCFAQTQIDPTYQIQWNSLSGSGAPSITCTQNGNYTVYPYGAEWGQPYQDTTNNVEYKCTTSGWVKNATQSALNTVASNGCLGGNTTANGCTGATTATGALTNLGAQVNLGATQTGAIGASGTATFPGNVAAGTVNGWISACSFPGATADVQIANAFLAGPNVDTTCYGASTQTIASTVAYGAAKYQRLRGSFSTVFQPSAASETMFNPGPYSITEGISVNTNNVTGYSVPVFLINGNARSALSGSPLIMHDINVVGSNTPVTGSACFEVNATSLSASQAGMHIDHTHCMGNQYGWEMLQSGTGFTNSNQWSDLTDEYSQINIYVCSVGASGAQFSGNTINGSYYEAGSAPQDGISFCSTALSTSNLFEGLSFQDITSGNPINNLSTVSAGNIFTGYWTGSVNDVTPGGAGGGNSYWNGSSLTLQNVTGANLGFITISAQNFYNSVNSTVLLPYTASGNTGFPGAVVGSSNPTFSGITVAGNVGVTLAGSANSYSAISVLQSSLGVGNFTGYQSGTALNSPHNAALVGFTNVGGSGSLANYAQLGIYGASALKVDGNANTILPGPLQNVNGTVIPSTATGYTGTATGKVVLSTGTGYSGTCAATTTLTVVNGIITGCS